MQWDLLPSPTCSTDVVSMSGILEPAYTIGGDAFDFAVNPGRVEFSIVDAVGHGVSAVSMSTFAVNSLRNARREGAGLETAYRETGTMISAQFGNSYFVTGQLGSIALDTGVLTWLNAGHPLPLLVRDQTFVGELTCAPSLPMGLGGSVAEIATEQLQPGDRVLFFTDGVSEAKSPAGEDFGVPRLADLLVRATLDGVSPAETARRLTTSIVTFNSAGLNDDATLLLVDYHGTH
jgi:serine phosphatase RsbU (regulator of sigma subunit)